MTTNKLIKEMVGFLHGHAQVLYGTCTEEHIREQEAETALLDNIRKGIIDAILIMHDEDQLKQAISEYELAPGFDTDIQLHDLAERLVELSK